MALVSRIPASNFFLAILLYLICSPVHSKSSPLLTTPTATVRRSILGRILAEEHHFIPALDQDLHYVGRWVPTSNLLRWDTAFPGAYLDLVVRNASVIYISLNNALSTSKIGEYNDEVKLRRMAFKPLDDREKAAAPVALMVTDCNGNTLHFSSSETGLIAPNLNRALGQAECRVRISYADGISQEAGVFQFKGIWLPSGASLRPRVQIEDESVTESDAEPNLNSQLRTPYRKTIELLTDSSCHLCGGSAMYRAEWLSQVAAQLNVDQVEIPAHDHCLTEACTNMRSIDISIQDLFFRSGPAGSNLFMRPWSFHHYVPDALVLDLGTTDYKSFSHPSTKHSEGHVGLRDTHQSLESFTSSFVNAYVAFIQQIRRSAYALHPSALERCTFDGDGYTYNSAPSTLPIFVMRPLDGSLEKATLSVVEQMQKDGDKSVFWIDTSGWLSDTDYNYQKMDQQSRSLTAAGHAKVASFMHSHLCHYLALHSNNCPFLRRDNYMGSAYVPVEAELDKVLEEGKIKKLTDLFWR